MPGAESFDVVVVGAGAAGCVVASRLSASHRVLLVEAGPDLRRHTPEALRDGWGLNRDYYWGTKSEPDELETGRPVPRCRLVGGTSWMTRFALRGSSADFVEWSSLGCPGWGFDDVLPHFVQLESDLDFPDDEFHGSRGPIPINRYLGTPRTEAHELAARACELAGFPLVHDHNRPGAVGVGRMPMSSRDGVRVSAADAYLPAASTSSLTVRPGTSVARVILDGTTARGVEMAEGTVVEASRVVVSAGVFGTPAILMRSGIGPADHLRSLGIDVFIDLPGVGERLGDHPGTDLDCGFDGPAREKPSLHTVATFHSRGTPESDPPDLMLWMADPDDDGFFINIVLLKPETRGTVRLRSPEVSDDPLVRLPVLRAGRDLDRLVEAYRVALEVAHHPSLRGLFRLQHDSSLSDEDIGALIMENSYSVPHFVGTCAMGAGVAEGAVVDTNGSVHGIEGLSVIDASIIPIVPSGFTHLPTLMVAERLSARVAAVL